MNTRTRGKNVPKDKDARSDPKSDARRSKTASTPDRSEPKRVTGDKEDFGTLDILWTLSRCVASNVGDGL